jgi:ribonuclease HI
MPYVIRKGKQKGIVSTREECKERVHGFPGAQYKKADSQQEAKAMLKMGYNERQRTQEAIKEKKKQTIPSWVLKHIASDASADANPGNVEYQCVQIQSGKKIFESKVYHMGTINCGEFLAIIEAMRYITKNNTHQEVFSDSNTAISRIQNKKIKTNLERNSANKELWKALDEGLERLSSQETLPKVHKRESSQW